MATILYSRKYWWAYWWICLEKLLVGLNFDGFQVPWTDDVTNWLPSYLTWAFLLLFPMFGHSKVPSSPSRTVFDIVPSYSSPVFRGMYSRSNVRSQEITCASVYLFCLLRWERECNTSSQVLPSADTSAGQGYRHIDFNNVKIPINTNIQGIMC